MRLAEKSESKAAEVNSEAKSAGGKEWEANSEAKSAGGKESCHVMPCTTAKNLKRTVVAVAVAVAVAIAVEVVPLVQGGRAKARRRRTRRRRRRTTRCIVATTTTTIVAVVATTVSFFIGRITLRRLASACVGLQAVNILFGLRRRTFFAHRIVGCCCRDVPSRSNSSSTCGSEPLRG